MNQERYYKYINKDRWMFSGKNIFLKLLFFQDNSRTSAI